MPFLWLEVLVEIWLFIVVASVCEEVKMGENFFSQSMGFMGRTEERRVTLPQASFRKHFVLCCTSRMVGKGDARFRRRCQKNSDKKEKEHLRYSDIDHEKASHG